MKGSPVRVRASALSSRWKHSQRMPTIPRRSRISAVISPACRRSGPNVADRNASLFAKSREIEVNDLAGHELVAKGNDIRKGNAQAAAAWGDPEPLPAARSAQRAPHGDNVVTERHALVLRSEVGECCEELHLVGRSHRVPALTAKAKRHRLEETVRREGLEDGINVPSGLRFAVSFEEPEHLITRSEEHTSELQSR